MEKIRESEGQENDMIKIWDEATPPAKKNQNLTVKDINSPKTKTNTIKTQSDDFSDS